MDNHLLFELTYVFHRICSAIIHDERRLMESSRKFCLFYPSCKEWLRNLTQCLLHNVSSHSLARRAFAFSSFKVLFIIGEGFTWWSYWPLSIHGVLFIIRRDIGPGRGSLLLCSMELLLQVFNLSLHGFIIISLVVCGRRGFSFENRFHLYGWYVHCLLDSFPDLFHVQDWENHLVDEHSQILPDADLFDVDLILPYLTVILN